jgi:hypothetical protein
MSAVPPAPPAWEPSEEAEVLALRHWAALRQRHSLARWQLAWQLARRKRALGGVRASLQENDDSDDHDDERARVAAEDGGQGVCGEEMVGSADWGAVATLGGPYGLHRVRGGGAALPERRLGGQGLRGEAARRAACVHGFQPLPLGRQHTEGLAATVSPPLFFPPPPLAPDVWPWATSAWAAPRQPAAVAAAIPVQPPSWGHPPPPVPQPSLPPPPPPSQPRQPAAGPPAGALMTITLPADVQPGKALRVRSPDGHLLTVDVPHGALPGAQIQIRAPQPPSVPSSDGAGGSHPSAPAASAPDPGCARLQRIQEQQMDVRRRRAALQLRSSAERDRLLQRVYQRFEPHTSSHSRPEVGGEGPSGRHPAACPSPLSGADRARHRPTLTQRFESFAQPPPTAADAATAAAAAAAAAGAIHEHPWQSAAPVDSVQQQQQQAAEAREGHVGGPAGTSRSAPSPNAARLCETQRQVAALRAELFRT